MKSTDKLQTTYAKALSIKAYRHFESHPLRHVLSIIFNSYNSKIPKKVTDKLQITLKKLPYQALVKTILFIGFQSFKKVWVLWVLWAQSNTGEDLRGAYKKSMGTIGTKYGHQ